MRDYTTKPFICSEATDHFTQSEVDEVDIALKNAEEKSRGLGGGDGNRGIFNSSAGGGRDFISLVAELPGIGTGYAREAQQLQAMAREQEVQNQRAGIDLGGPPGSAGVSGTKPSTSSAATGAASNPNQVPGMSATFDPVETARKIYPILEFRDKIVRAISNTISKIPGLEKLIEHISETLSAFVLGLLAPFIRPIINQVSKVLKDGSSGVISASAKSQLEPWTDPNCTNPTHSMLSKDHFTNVLNSCAGRVAATVLQYAVPRILYAWDNPNVPVDEVVNDLLRAFHHPAIRDERVQIQHEMFETVRRWVNEYPRRNELNHLLSSQSVKDGRNHVLANGQPANTGGGHSHGGGGGYSHGSGGGAWSNLSKLTNLASGGGGGNTGSIANAIFSQFKTRDLSALDGRDLASPAPGNNASVGPSSSFGYVQGGAGSSGAASAAHAPSGGAADSYLNPQASAPAGPTHHHQQPPQGYAGDGAPYGGPSGPSWGSPMPGYGPPVGQMPYGIQPGHGQALPYGQPPYTQPPYGQFAYGQPPQGPPNWGQPPY